MSTMDWRDDKYASSAAKEDEEEQEADERDYHHEEEDDVENERSSEGGEDEQEDAEMSAEEGEEEDNEEDEGAERRGHSEVDSEMAVLSSQSAASTRLTAPRSAGSGSENTNNNSGGAAAAAAAAAKQRAAAAAAASATQYDSSPKRPNLWTRLYNERELHNEKIEKLRRQAEEMRRLEELAQEGHRSVAAERHANAVFSHDFFEHQEQWLDDIEVRRQKLKLAAELEELRTLRDPAINAKSRRIVNELGYCGPIEAWDVHFARFCVRHERSLPSHMFKPNINVQSKGSRVNANGETPSAADAGARLYDESISRRAKLRQTEKKQRELELKDPVTGQPFFQPMSYTKESDVVSQRKTRSAQEASDTLYQRALEQREKKKRQVEKAQEKHSFQPELSAATRNMDIKRRPVHEAVKRAPPPDKNAGKVLAKSTSLSREQFMTRMEAMQARRQKKLEVLQDMKQKMEEKSCTFHPRVSKTSEEIFEGSQQRIMMSMPSHQQTPMAVAAAGGGGKRSNEPMTMMQLLDNNNQMQAQQRHDESGYHEGFVPPPAASFSTMMMAQGGGGAPDRRTGSGGGGSAPNSYINNNNNQNYYYNSNTSMHSNDPHYRTNANMSASNVVHSPAPRVPSAKGNDSEAYYYQQNQDQYVDPTGNASSAAPHVNPENNNNHNGETFESENRLSVPLSDEVEDAEEMIENFESKMKEVLSEWKKLETL